MPKNEDRKLEYKRLKDAAPAVVRCEVCGSLGAKRHMDPHHPHGRSGSNLLIFVWAHRHCHNLGHDNVAAAKRIGFIQPINTTEKQYHDSTPDSAPTTNKG